MKISAQRLWILLLSTISAVTKSSAALVTPENLANSPCAFAQQLIIYNFSVEEAQQSLTDFNLGYDKNAQKLKPSTKIDYLLRLRKPQAQAFFMQQSRASCSKLRTLTPQANLFLEVCRSLGNFGSSMRSCLQLHCDLIANPNLSYAELTTILMRYASELGYRTALPQLQHCPELTKQGQRLLNSTQQASLAELSRLLQETNLFIKPKDPKNNSLAYGSDGENLISDPLDLAWLIETNHKLAESLRAGCFLVAQLRPEPGNVFIDPQCGSPIRAIVYTDIEGAIQKFPEMVQLNSQLSTALTFLFTLISLGFATHFFWPKKAKAARAKPLEIKTKITTTKSKKKNKFQMPFAKKNYKKPSKFSHATEPALAENPVLKKLASFYVFAEYLYQHRLGETNTRLLEDFHRILDDLPFAFDMDMSEVYRYAEPPKSIKDHPLEQWNSLLASAVVACEREYPDIARELSSCYFLPGDFPAEIYHALHKLKNELDEHHKMTLQGSALANYERSSDLDLLVHWNEKQLRPAEFTAKLETCFSPCKIQPPYHNKKRNIYVYKIILGNGRQLDLSYVPKNVAPLLPLFTSAEGKYTLGEPGGIQYSLAYARFLVTREIQFSSESAQEQLAASVSALTDENALEADLERVAYALNHLAKAEERSYAISAEIIAIIENLAGRHANADTGLNILISSRYSENSGRIFKFMQNLAILHPKSSICFGH